MKEYQKIINQYSLKGYEMYSKTVNKLEWGNIGIAEAYLEKYWLTFKEYKEKWKPIMKLVFQEGTLGFPEIIFNSSFRLLAVGGGVAFVKEDYLLLQECMLEIGEQEFVVVENDAEEIRDEPFFRMKFPVKTTWEELTSGNFASATWLESIHKEFFIFGDSGSWGKYSANDYDYPLDILGCLDTNLDFFKHRFMPSEDEWKEVYHWLPTFYKNKVLSPL